MLQVDDDWKAQAQKEKEKLAEREKANQAAKAPAPASAPAAAAAQRAEMSSFSGLVQSLATQSLMMMGAIPDPRTGRAVQDLGYAKSLMDSVAMLEDKTQNNLTAEESSALASTLYELRDTYVRSAWASRSTAAA